MATMMAMGLSEIIWSLTQDSGHTPDLVFLLEQWPYNLKLEEFLLSWSDHILITMRFCGTAIHYTEAEPIILACPGN